MSALVIAFILGLVHGVTPDEHTWPITFSYAVGSANPKGGMKAGLIFSSGFTIQRAILSEAAFFFFAMTGIFLSAVTFGITYILVGFAMVVAGLYIMNKGKYLHWHSLESIFGSIFLLHPRKGDEHGELSHTANPIMHSDDDDGDFKPVPSKLAFVHGLIAGFGFGPFALVVYTILVPVMGSPYLAFLPGLLFGIGTMVMQILFGGAVATWLSKSKGLSEKGVAYVGKSISSFVLTYGGLAFMLGGMSVLYYPQLLNYGINTGINIPNLNSINIGFIMVIFVVFAVGSVGYVYAIRNAIRLGYSDRPRGRGLPGPAAKRHAKRGAR